MAEEGVLKYLTDTNRPYSANDIVANLNKQWTKTGVQKALDALVEKDQVMEKTYGKQKVYMVRQTDEIPDENEIHEIESSMRKNDLELKEIKAQLKLTESELKMLTSSISTAEALKEIDTLTIETEKLQDKLDKLSENSVPISPEEMKKVKDEANKVSKEYKLRRRICLDMVDAVLESYPKTKKDFIEELGLETDEAAEFTFVEM